MLLESKLVRVPADRELEADVNEYGRLSTSCLAQFGAAAIEAGREDEVEQETPDAASAAIANILHCVDRDGHAGEVDRVLERAREHYEADARG